MTPPCDLVLRNARATTAACIFDCAIGVRDGHIVALNPERAEIRDAATMANI